MMDPARHPLPSIARKALLISSIALCVAAGASVAGVPAPDSVQSPALQINEGFDDAAALFSTGWFQQNNSDPRGVTDWYQGLPAQFSSYDGELGSYIAANLNNTDRRGMISNWLVTPVLEFGSGAAASFFTRSGGGYYVDRMQVRLCTGTDCTNVGTAATDVGDFTTLLLDINSHYEYEGYPTTWTQQILDGLPTSGTGRIAFRYFVESGGAVGDNSNYVGIDRFVFDSGNDATPVPSAGLSFAPETINAGETSTLKITLQNPADDFATLDNAFTNAFPMGVVLTLDPNESTTCDSGTVTTTASSVTLASGATIPAKGACSITVNVTAMTEGDFDASIAAGALATDLGTSVGSASATLHVLPQLAPPTAVVYPSALSFTVPETSTASDAVSISNAPNAETLTFSVESRGSADRGSIPLAAGRHYSTQDGRDVGQKKRLAPSRDVATYFSSMGKLVRGEPAPWAPRSMDSALDFQIDDGSVEESIGLSTGSIQYPAVALNRFEAPEGVDSFTIDTISVQWPTGALAGGDLTGKQVNLLAYYDADADGDPSNAVRLGGDTLVTIGSPGTFETYATDFSVPGAGDVYVGFEDVFAAGGTTPILYDISIDVDTLSDASYLVAQSGNSGPDINDLSNNDMLGTLSAVTGGVYDGSFVVRATASLGSGAACTGPIVSWIRATPESGTLEAEENASVTVSVNPLAADLAPGDYSAELCVTTNDPTQPLIQIPISLTVTAAAPPPSGSCDTADTIFCDGFDGADDSSTIVRGTINQVVPHNADGASLNLVTGVFHPYDVADTSDDINLYNGDLTGSLLYSYWYGDVVPSEFSLMVGGVVDDVGLNYAVLQSGDTVGPDAIKGGNRQLSNWLYGTDGYLGIAFYNEDTGMVNYGYIHLVTTAPDGFPANVLEYAYDSSGAPITIP